ncbi:MAG: HepT-like ribonuclease domain-containing protein [Chitinophagaceae bacterium]
MDAVIRNFKIIGEAANQLPEEIRDQNPAINWSRIKVFRNRIVQDDMEINFQIVGIIKETFLPECIRETEKILEKLNGFKIASIFLFLCPSAL